MKILSIERTGLGNYILWIASGRFYQSYCVERDGNYTRIKILKQVPKRIYPDYPTFVGIMGKFNPCTKFLCNPIPIKDLSIETLNQIQT